MMGLGTWQLQGKTCEKAVELALEMGYRHIDTAFMYENHREIAKGMKGFPREKLFLTSKFIPDQLAHASLEETYQKACKELQTDYLDLFLLHYPERKTLKKTMQDLNALKEKKKGLQIGVSNCTIHHLQDILSWGINPAYNQVEFHPELYQKDLLEFCNKNKITLISYRSLGKGVLLDHLDVKMIAKRRGKTPAQILLRWCVEKGIPVIPKASSQSHLQENFRVFDFALDKEDLAILDHFSTSNRFCNAVFGDFDY